mmetsp:Transcript_17/g.34  ORF Transcript_17/g.34 Transcript_17/m.34 type:complete len:81 (+) Transcript_17:691-933(+)
MHTRWVGTQRDMHSSRTNRFNMASTIDSRTLIESKSVAKYPPQKKHLRPPHRTRGCDPMRRTGTIANIQSNPVQRQESQT